MTITRFISNLLYINNKFIFDENKNYIFVFYNFDDVSDDLYINHCIQSIYDVLEDFLNVMRKEIPYSLIGNSLCFTIKKTFLEK